MASTSKQYRDSDLEDFPVTVESEDEIEDSDDQSDSDSELEETTSQIPTNKRKRNEPLFDWLRDAFSPNVHYFDDSNSGISAEIPEDPTALDFFHIYFTPEIMEKICEETNQYYGFVTNARPTSSKSRLQKWQETTPDELYVFFALTMLMARVKKLSIKDYWSTDTLLVTPQFSEYMSRDRYLLLLRLLHFNNNYNQPPGDRMYKINPILDHLRKTFKGVFHPFENVCIDESLVLFKGRLAFQQYIPSKRHRFGIKLFVICDCETGYVMDVIVYTGTTTNIVKDRTFGFSGAVVQTLMDDYLQKGHTLWLDNWYSSPQLFDWLHQNGTNACGTVRKNRKGMPSFEKKLKRGEVEVQHTDKMMALKWLDKRKVFMLTTLHKNEMKQTGKRDPKTNEQKVKPSCIVQYNSNMGSIDRSDMMLSSVECVRKSLKWYRKLFFHLLDITVVNCQTIYNVKTGKNISIADFGLTVIREILTKYHKPGQRLKRGRLSTGDLPLRLTERHFSTPVPPTPKKQNPTRYCHVCTHTSIGEKKRRESRYMCAKCGVALCVHPCFEKYHTVVKF